MNKISKDKETIIKLNLPIILLIYMSAFFFEIAVFQATLGEIAIYLIGTFFLNYLLYRIIYRLVKKFKNSLHKSLLYSFISSFVLAFFLIEDLDIKRTISYIAFYSVIYFHHKDYNQSFSLRTKKN